MNLSENQVKAVVRVGGLDVTKETVPKAEVASEAEAVVAARAVAMTVAVLTAVAVVDMTAVLDTTVAEGVEILVWGKLHSATTPKVPLYTVKYET